MGCSALLSYCKGHSGLGAMMAGGNPDEGREENDFYPTPPDVTEALMRMLPTLRMLPMLGGTTIWEPCAGDGAMVDVMERHGCSVIKSDLNPLRDDIDLLDIFDSGLPTPALTMMITNPPFNLAEKIIRHAFDIGVPRMALLLKSTYWHSKRRQKLFSKHRPSHVMPLTWRPDFMGKKRPTMEISWMIWGSPCAEKTAYVPIDRPT